MNPDYKHDEKFHSRILMPVMFALEQGLRTIPSDDFYPCVSYNVTLFEYESNQTLKSIKEDVIEVAKNARSIHSPFPNKDNHFQDFIMFDDGYGFKDNKHKLLAVGFALNYFSSVYGSVVDKISNYYYDNLLECMCIAHYTSRSYFTNKRVALLLST